MALKPRDIALRAASAVVLAPAAVLATWAGGDWFCALVVAGAVLCSTLIGMVFGYVPARSAARLAPTEALGRA